MRIVKIISGGQAGADRAGLDFAIEMGIPHGGWCPAGRRSEIGRIPDMYNLQETESKKYLARTKKNVLSADVTIIFSHGDLTGGSLETLKKAIVAEKPYIYVDLNDSFDWLPRLEKEFGDKNITINIAGPRPSKDADIYQGVMNNLHAVLGGIKSQVTENPVCLFDLDNTLTNRKLSIRKYAQCFIDEFNDVIEPGQSVGDIAEIINLADNGGYVSTTSRATTVRGLVADALLNGVVEDTHKSDELLKNITDHFGEYCPKHAVPMEGAEECLKKLKERGWKLAVVSNGAKRSRNSAVKALGFEKYMEFVLSSEEVGVKKPDSLVFTTALEKIWAKPEETWYVGDHPVNDIEGARAVGIRPIWFKGFHEWPDGIIEPTYKVDSFDELITVLKDNSSFAVER